MRRLVKKPELVRNYKKAWKWFSVQAMIASAAIQLTWSSMPEDLKQSISPKTAQVASISLLVLGVVGRMVKQKDDDSN